MLQASICTAYLGAELAQLLCTAPADGAVQLLGVQQRASAIALHHLWQGCDLQERQHTVSQPNFKARRWAHTGCP